VQVSECSEDQIATKGKRATRREKIDKLTTIRKKENGEWIRAKATGANQSKLTSSRWNGT